MTSMVYLIADSAPAPYRRQLLLSADPQLRSDLATITARPRSIRRLHSARAIAAVNMIDDLATLAAVRAVETRTKVGQALSDHPLAERVPHHLWCPTCRKVTGGVASVEEFMAVLNDDDCLAAVRTVELTEDPAVAAACWQAMLATNFGEQRVKAQAALRLNAATGTIDATTPWVSAALSDSVTWREGTLLRDLIPRLAAQNVETVRLWSLNSTGLPPADYDAALLKQLLADAAVPSAAGYGITHGMFGPDDIVELWDHLRMDHKVQAVRTFTADPFLTWALERLADDPAWVERTGSGQFNEIADVLRARPDLSSRHRLIVLSAGQYEEVVSLAAGDYGFEPRPGEVRAAAEQLLAAKDFRPALVIWTKRQADRNGAMTRPGMVELADYLIETVEAGQVLAGGDQLSSRAHRRLWTCLADDASRTTALGLLGAWNGTIPSLIETVTLLEPAA